MGRKLAPPEDRMHDAFRCQDRKGRGCRRILAATDFPWRWRKGYKIRSLLCYACEAKRHKESRRKIKSARTAPRREEPESTPKPENQSMPLRSFLESTVRYVRERLEAHYEPVREELVRRTGIPAYGIAHHIQDTCTVLEAELRATNDRIRAIVQRARRETPNGLARLLDGPSENVLKAETLLGLTPPYTVEDVKTAHRTRAALLHPDRAQNTSQSEVANRATAQVNAAKDTLLDHLRREH